MTAPSLLAFDLNETILSLAPIKAKLEDAFGREPPVGEWFARMLHGSLVANHTDAYRDFGVIGVEALLAVAQRRGVDMSKETAQSIVSTMTALPPHPDVYNAMERLSTPAWPW